MKGNLGRPRKPLPGPHLGHNSGTATHEPSVNGGDERGALVTVAVVPIDQIAPQTKVPIVQVPPRVLSLRDAARYLGMSQWTIRDMEHSGLLPRIRVPLPNNGELRKLLFAREDLDRAVEAWKEKGS